jgi:hypothetical protein
MNRMSESFLVQTSLDYNMPLHEVKRIASYILKIFTKC